MFRKATGALAAIALVASLATASAPATAAGVSITGEGSSFAGTALIAAQSKFNAKGGAQVNYTKSSSSKGRANVAAGTVDFGASDITYVAAGSTAPANTVLTPLLGGPIAIVYNLPSVGKGLRLDPATLGAIFSGRITMWNHANIKKLNPTKSLPAKAISVRFRAAGSGTTANLTQYLAGNKVTGWTANNGDFTKASGAASVVGVSVPSSADMVTAVDNTSYTIGYVDLADAAGKGLVYASIKNPAGQYVLPTATAAKSFLAAQTVPTDGSVKINFLKKISGAYNLSAFAYGIASSNYADASKGAAVKAFFTYVVSNAVPTGYVALSGAAKTAALKQIAKIK